MANFTDDQLKKLKAIADIGSRTAFFTDDENKWSTLFMLVDDLEQARKERDSAFQALHTAVNLISDLMHDTKKF